jgi:hypothetical protein
MTQPLNLANPLTMLLMAAATAFASEQVWMAENLNYKTGISRCYDDNESNCKKDLAGGYADIIGSRQWWIWIDKR